jgi:DNA-binding transcriptional ArsR family regulator
MLEHLFGSKTRVRLLRLFLHHPEEAFFVRELARKTNFQMNSVRRELENLTKFGVLVENKQLNTDKEKGPTGQRRYYKLNTDFVLYHELRALLMKSQVLLEQNFISRVQDMGTVKYLALTGRFVDDTSLSTDMLVIGKVNRERLERLIHDFERELGASIRFTVLTVQEFSYRKQVGDKFIYSILEARKMVVVDELMVNET